MATTPGKPTALPRSSSGIPTPGRVRSSSNAASRGAAGPVPKDEETMSRAFADAIRANDPALHKPGPRISDVSSVSTLSASTASSASFRPSSASSVSSAGSVPPRAKTPAGTRSVSRASDFNARSASRAGRTFEVGDNVRIESLGFEGKLQYLGEIDGKPGIWAGVALSAGFVGKGKNDGSVAGKQYFLCPPKCGVFVATTKLSAPTVGPGSYSRPSSVASNYNNGRVTPSMSSSTYGRMTPSMSSVSSSGRITPAMSNGRITPSMSSGRITPGMSSSSIGGRLPSLMKTPVAPTARKTMGPPPGAVTPGSRASKYAGIAAQQLRNSPARTGLNSPSRSDFSSPGRASLTSSPSRSNASPMNTPKPMPRTSMATKSRPSFALKPRVPDDLTMPPPQSPGFQLMSLENSPPKSSSQLEMDGNALQDKINQLMSGRQTPSSPSIKRGVLPRSQSSQSWAQGIEDPTEEIERLRSRLESLEYENKSLREVQEHELAAADDRKLAEALAANEADRAELDETKIRISELEGFLRNSERSTHERDSKIEALERTVQSISSDFSKLQADSESRARGFREDLESNEALVLSLKEAIAAREGAAAESDAVAAAKDAEVASLQSKLARTQAELDEERRELGAQVDELRHAGQETIALYEERLSSADVIRYELEDALAAAKDELRARAKEPPASPGTAARRAVSAAEIDNEALREQVQHLQKQLAQLEDQLDDARADAERGEAAVEDRARRHKDREEAHAKDLEVAHGEIEDLRKAEERAKSKVLDLEDAVREGAEALENARAEIEGLRAEVGNLQALAASGEHSGLGDVSLRSNADRSVSLDDVTSLKAQITQLETSKADLQKRLANAEMEAEESDNALRSAKEDAAHIEAHKAQLEDAIGELQAKYEQESQVSIQLQQRLDEATRELEISKSSHVNGSVASIPASPSRHDVHAAREEVKGLKTIVQELNQDNHKAQQQIKTLESENKLLTSEMEQLRDDLRQLEENLEQSILRDEQAMENGSAPTVPSHGQGTSEAELLQLRKKLTDAEAKNARTVHDLTKEISELEALLETKIYREDELERELETLRRRSSKTARKTSKSSLELDPVPEDRPASSFANGTGSATSTATAMPKDGAHSRSNSLITSESDVCEICERPGHDIFSCDLLKESSSPTLMMSRIVPEDATVVLSPAKPEPSRITERLYCEDCDSEGHTSNECPYALDVF